MAQGAAAERDIEASASVACSVHASIWAALSAPSAVAVEVGLTMIGWIAMMGALVRVMANWLIARR